MYSWVESSLPRSVSPCHAYCLFRIEARASRLALYAARLVRSVAHRPIDRDAFTETDSDSSTVTKRNVFLKSSVVKSSYSDK
jgi:hypothetical protein